MLQIKVSELSFADTKDISIKNRQQTQCNNFLTLQCSHTVYFYFYTESKLNTLVMETSNWLHLTWLCYDLENTARSVCVCLIAFFICLHSK